MTIRFFNVFVAQRYFAPMDTFRDELNFVGQRQDTRQSLHGYAVNCVTMYFQV